ncbi:calcium-binding protein [Metapseudomonas otitidis]|uniref:calcium-binding protein n=1 Tax=Metapseudomonas otitidis TaxID=319939 RepID=UPI0013F616F4
MGNDTLDGGTGNDTLSGEGGDDTFLFGMGDGQDTITELSGNDTLLLTQGINASDVWFKRTSNNLELSVLGSDDKVTISNWYASASNHVETIKTADGKTLLDSQVQNLVNAMAAFAPPTAGNSNLTPEQRAQLEVVIAANWH